MIERGVLEAIATLVGSDDDYLVATVVRVVGSAYRRPGARMVLARDGRWLAGGVSAGCLETALAAKAWWWLGARDAVVVTFDADADHDDGAGATVVGSGCGGSLDVLIERGTHAGGALGAIARCDRTQVRGGIATVFDGEHLGARASVEPGYVIAERTLPAPLRLAMVRAADAAREVGATTRVVTLAGCSVLVEAIVPRPRLFVLGTHADAVPVAALARGLGWEVAVVGTSARAGVNDRFAGIADQLIATGAQGLAALIDKSCRAAVVIMSHDYAADRDYLAVALASRARYIGQLGPRARSARMLGELGRAGDLRLHAPAGLALGAETPAEIALAILAEAQAALVGVQVEPLRDRTRDRPIHDAIAIAATS